MHAILYHVFSWYAHSTAAFQQLYTVARITDVSFLTDWKLLCVEKKTLLMSFSPFTCVPLVTLQIQDLF